MGPSFLTVNISRMSLKLDDSEAQKNVIEGEQEILEQVFEAEAKKNYSVEFSSGLEIRSF